MKGRLYFTTKSQKEGRIMIKTHPCAQIFCCDLCGFEQVQCNIVICSYIVFMTVNNIIVMVNNTQFVSFYVIAPPQVCHWGPLHTNFSCLLLSSLLQIDAEQYYSELEEKLTDEFNAEKNRITMKRLGIAFVTFRDERMTAV